MLNSQSTCRGACVRVLLRVGRHVVLPTEGRHVGSHVVLPTAGRHVILLTAGRQASG